jgi:transcriptional regulator with XRE-family HTH domain
MKRVHLKTARERRGWTQEQLAEASGLSQATISNLESNPDARPAFGTVVDLATALDVDPQALRFGPAPSKRQAVSA